MALASICSGVFGCAGYGPYGTRPKPSAPWNLPLGRRRRLLLVGDAGAKGFSEVGAAEPSPDPQHCVMGSVATLVRCLGQQRRKQVQVVMLGDNLYPAGIRERLAAQLGSPELKALDAQLEATAQPKVFLGGNHDWAHWGEQGLQARSRMARYLKRRGKGRAELLPRGDGSHPHVEHWGLWQLVYLDTQGFLHAASYLPAGYHRRWRAAFRETLAGLDTTRPVIFMGHHPLTTYGKHGGYFHWTDHLFPLRELADPLWIPLPIVGSAYPLLRGQGLTPQDRGHARYGKLVELLRAAMGKFRQAIYVAGHEHNLQVFQPRQGQLELVSGSGSKRVPLANGPKLAWGAAARGLMSLDLGPKGGGELVVFAQSEDGYFRTHFRSRLPKPAERLASPIPPHTHKSLK